MLNRQYLSTKATDIRIVLSLEVVEDNVTLLPDTREKYVEELAIVETLLVAYDLGAIEAEWLEASGEPLFHPIADEQWGTVDESITRTLEKLQVCSEQEWHAYVSGEDTSLLDAE